MRKQCHTLRERFGELLTVAALALFANAAGAADVAEIEHEGKTCFRLSSDLIEAVVSPADGGRVIHLLDKTTGDDLTSAESATGAPAGSGLFGERLWPKGGKQVRSYETSEFEVLETKSEDGAASVALRSAGKPLSIEKRIILRDGQRSIQAEYAITNPGQEDFTGLFWSFGLMLPPASEEWTMRLPAGHMSDTMYKTGPANETTIKYSRARPEAGNFYIDDPAQDYTIVLGDRLGLAMIMPFDRLGVAYSHHSSATSQSLKVPTVEWFSDPLYLPPYAKGVEDAANHPELENPLQDYVYTFGVSVEVFEAAAIDPANYRPAPGVPKLDRFLPPISDLPLFTDFRDRAPIWLSDADPIPLLAVVKGVASTEMFEFARRFPLDLRIVEVDNPHVFSAARYLSWVGHDPQTVLEQELEKTPEVILLSGIFESAMPGDLVNKIIQIVEDGTPLIYVSKYKRFPSLLKGKGTPVTEDIFANIPFWKLPVGAPQVDVFQCGKGSVYWVKYDLTHNNRPYKQNTAITPWLVHDGTNPVPYWEYYFSFYGRLLQEAVGREADLVIAGMKADESLSLQVNSTKEGAARVDLSITGPDGLVIHDSTWEGAVRTGINRVELALPPEITRMNGDYFLNVRTSLDGRGQDWGTVVRTIRGPRELETLMLDNYAHRGDNPVVQGRVSVKGSGGHLSLRLIDSHGRVLANETREAAEGASEFSLKPLTRPFVALAEVVATLEHDGVTVDRIKRTLTLEPRPRSDLSMVVWRQGGNAWFFRDFERAHREMGFNVGIGAGIQSAEAEDIFTEAESVMRSGLHFAPLGMHRISIPVKALEDKVREPCLRDTSYLEAMREDVRRTVTMTRDSMPAIYYSGDENSLGNYDKAHDFCHSPACLSAFRSHLKEKHGSLAALNKRWKSDYPTWEDIVPPTLFEAQDQNHMAPWIEHRVFMMTAVSDTLKAMKRELTRLAPEAKLGFSGQRITNINGAFNWPEAMLAEDYSTAYLHGPDILLDMVRSKLRPGASGGAWVGYGHPPQDIRWNYWRQIANGWFSPSYWHSNDFIRRGDQRLSSQGEHLKSVFAEISASGVEPMLTRSAHIASPFTILYSIPSFVSCVSTGLNSVFHTANFVANLNSWGALIRDMGYQPPRVITESDLLNADLSAHRIIVLPMAQMLSDAAIDALRNFTEGGGALIMDAQAGILDEFGLPREENRLAALAGVSVSAATSGGAAGGALYGDRSLKVTLTNSRVQLAGGENLATIGERPLKVEMDGLTVTGGPKNAPEPAFVFAGAGRGKAAYLNCLLTDYATIRGQAGAAGPIRNAVKDLLSALLPDLPEPHKLPSSCEAHIYEGHGNKYMIIVRQAGSDDPQALVNLESEHHVYDTMEHRYLGAYKSLPLEIPPYKVKTLAFLPAKLAPMSGDVEWSDGKFKIKLNRATASPAGVVRLEVSCNGASKPHYSGNHILQNELDIEVDPGLIPETGNWEFIITDLFDGADIRREIGTSLFPGATLQGAGLSQTGDANLRNMINEALAPKDTEWPEREN